MIFIYSRATSRRSSLFWQIDKIAEVSTLFKPQKALGQGTYGIVRSFVDESGEQTLAVKSNRLQFNPDETEKEYLLMQKAYPAPGKYHLFYFANRERADRQEYRYIMPEFQGETLEIWVAQQTCSYQLAKSILLVAMELHRLHEMQIIHGDPLYRNILVSAKEGEPRVSFIDFGLSNPTHGKVPKFTLTSRQKCIYPPEITWSTTAANPKQDIFTLGQILKSVLFRHPNYEDLQQHFPSISNFLVQSVAHNPHNRLSLDVFCKRLTEEIEANKPSEIRDLDRTL